jgi:hypothetical protein
MRHTISFQYMAPDYDAPRAGYEITDAELELPEGAHVPRVGEFLQLITDNGTDDYVVFAVNTRIFMVGQQDPGWHTYITVGPGSEVKDKRLLMIRE